MPECSSLGGFPGKVRTHPEGPSTHHLRFLVPKTVLSMVFGTRDLKYWVLGPYADSFGKALILRPPAKSSMRAIAVSMLKLVIRV